MSLFNNYLIIINNYYIIIYLNLPSVRKPMNKSVYY